MEIPITQERNPNPENHPKVIQCKVTDIKMPTRLRMIAYQGPFEHLIERALNEPESNQKRNDVP